MEGKEDAIEKLRQLVSEDKNLIVRLDDDKIFLRYLYYQNFDINKAYDQMKTIYKQKVDYYDWYATERNERQDEILRKEIHTMMQPRDALGRRVYIVKLGNIALGDFQVNEMSQVDDLWLEAVMDEPETQKNGIVFLIDMKGVTWKFMKYFTPTNCKVGSLKAESIPLQNIQFHIVNSGMLLNTMVSLVFPLLSKETKERIHFHKSNWDSLHQQISSDALPEEYGGKSHAIDYEKNIEHFLKSKNDRLLELLGYGYQSNKAESAKNNS